MKEKTNGFLLFLRRNVAYVVLALCILAIGLTVTFVLLSRDNKIDIDSEIPVIKPDEPDKPNQPDTPDTPDEPDTPDTPDEPIEPEEPVIETIKFIIPVENLTGMSDYSETPVFSSTLSRYSAHKAIDFYAAEGSKVFAVYGGTVESVTNDILKGYTIVINHGNGLKTTYNSLADGDKVVKGQKVSKGDVIGAVSVTNRQEYKDGAHIHFEVSENGATIDPAKYMDISEK